MGKYEFHSGGYIVKSFFENGSRTVVVTTKSGHEVFHSASFNEEINTQAKANDFIHWLNIIRTRV